MSLLVLCLSNVGATTNKVVYCFICRMAQSIAYHLFHKVVNTTSTPIWLEGVLVGSHIAEGCLDSKFDALMHYKINLMCMKFANLFMQSIIKFSILVHVQIKEVTQVYMVVKPQCTEV